MLKNDSQKENKPVATFYKFFGNYAFFHKNTDIVIVLLGNI